MNRISYRSETTRRLAIGALLAVAMLAPVLPASAKVAIQEVKSDKGITAWLVEDYSVPVVAIRFIFEGGSTSDPAGKEGLAELMTGLFDEGAGTLDSDAFQTKLDDSGAEMRFGAGNDSIYGSMRMLADNKDVAFDLLRKAIDEPRFDAGPVARIRSQMVAGIVANQREPGVEAQKKWAKAIYGDHPYSRPDEGTAESLAAITPDDLRAFHHAMFARDKLFVSVVGAIDAETVKRKLDLLFGDLPEKSGAVAVPDVTWKLGQQLSVDYPLPQTSLQLAYPGVDRKDPDFFAAYIMNHILGGGTFSSRLFDEVRERRGLAYSVSSGLVNQDHGNGLIIGTATRSDRAAETLSVIRDVVKKMAEEGPTEAELAAAKKYIIGSYALNNLDSSGAIAGTLISLQTDHLGIDYMDRRTALIDGVTLDQVKAAAKRLLTVEPAIMVVGPPLAESSKG